MPAHFGKIPVVKMAAASSICVVFTAILLSSGAQAARFVERGVDRSVTLAGKGTQKRQDDLTPEAAADEILELPGFQNALPSNHFGGYITVNEKRGRKLFYYFVESERDPANDPVVLWLNGGPGCSSFDGFIFEQGPFLFSLGRKPQGGLGWQPELRSNPYAWSKVANMIFLDSPAGVGMSYSETAADYEVDDSRTAVDADAFLRGWFSRFPQYLDNEFYVSGESYAGIYVPNLVRQVLLGNEAGLEPNINIVGYLVGNGCTDERYDGNAHPLFAVGKSLLPWKGFTALQSECGGGEYWNRTQGSTCDKMWNHLSANLAALNVYDTLEDCFHDGESRIPEARNAVDSKNRRRQRRRAALSTDEPASSTFSAATTAARPHAGLLAERLEAAGLVGVWPVAGGSVRPGLVLNWAHVYRKLGLVGITPPCTDSRVADLWLNDPRVREAIHAAPISEIGPWTLCSDKIYYYRTHGSMIPIHINNTKGHGLRALIYSGDHDMAVPHTGSEAWTSDLGFPVKAAWQPWYVADDQVAGYVVEYAHGLSYATVKGAGHMVPETNPREALVMFERFLARKPLA